MDKIVRERGEDVGVGGRILWRIWGVMFRRLEEKFDVSISPHSRRNAVVMGTLLG